jgi:Flp pilus assembly protein CpaB
VATLLTVAQRGPGGVEVLIARQAVPAGTLLDAATLEAVFAGASIETGEPLAGMVGDRAAVVDRRTAADLVAGEPLTLAALGGGALPVAPLAVGERAVPVPVQAAGSAAAALRPGVLVDVVASTGEGVAGRTRVVVAAAEVLAVDGTVTDGFGQAAGGGSVLLRAGARDALVITAALNFARDVRLLPRPEAEGRGTAAGEVAAP